MPGWFMPGGGLKRRETLENAARREAREEAGATLGTLKLMGAYTDFSEWKTDHNIVFIADDFKMEGEHDREVVEIRFFSLEALPAGLRPGHRRRLEEYLTAQNSPAFGEW
jgi:8-oxo-dGTP pyrophosphatase MutT (NUDIX family)